MNEVKILQDSYKIREGETIKCELGGVYLV